MHDCNILIVNGVNLSQIGSRETDVYGCLSFGEYLSELRRACPKAHFEVFQSDDEGSLAACLAQARDYDGIVLNAGAYTHTSVVLADAVRTTPCPVIEVHISNLYARERYRRESALTGACRGLIAGFGLDSYRLAADFIMNMKDRRKKMKETY